MYRLLLRVAPLTFDRERMRSRSRAFALIFFSLILPMTILYRVSLHGEVPLYSNTSTIYDPAPSTLVYSPATEIAARILKTRGSLLWSSTHDFGAPVNFSLYEGGLLHPWVWFRSLLPFEVRWQINAIGIFFFGLLIHIALARRVFGWNASASACFAAFAMTNFCFIRQISHHSVLVYACGALGLLGVFESFSLRRISRSDALRIYLLESVGGALAFVGGFPEELLPVLLLSGACCLYGFFFLPRRRWLAGLALLTTSGVTAIFLSSYAVFGFFEGLGLRGGTGFRGQRGQDFVELNQFYKLFIRFDQGIGTKVFYAFGSVMLFLMVLALVTGSWCRTPRALRWAFFTSALFFIVHMFKIAGPLDVWIGNQLPFSVSGFWCFYPPLIVIPAAWLAASAVQSFSQDSKFWTGLPTRQVIQLFFGYFAILAFCLVSWRLMPPIEGFHRTEINRLLPVLTVLLVFITSWLLCRRFPLAPYVRHSLSAVIIAAYTAELILCINGIRFVGRDQAASILFNGHKVELDEGLCALKEKNDFRLFKPNAWTTHEYCLATPEGFPSLLVPRNESFKGAFFRHALELQAPSHALTLALTSVRWYYAPAAGALELKVLGAPFHISKTYLNGFSLIEIPNALPRAYLATKCKTVSNMATAIDAIKSATFLLGDAMIESIDPHDQLDCAMLDRDFSRAAHKPLMIPVNEDAGATLKLSSVMGPGLLVLNDSYYPGWSARDQISGSPLPILPTNGMFRGVMLKEKRPYQVEFRYEPKWLPAARFMVSLGMISILLSGAALFATHRSISKVLAARAVRKIK